MAVKRLVSGMVRHDDEISVSSAVSRRRHDAVERRIDRCSLRARHVDSAMVRALSGERAGAPSEIGRLVPFCVNRLLEDQQQPYHEPDHL